MRPSYLRPLAGAILVLACRESPAAIVEYRIAGVLVKDPISDNLFAGKTARVPFEIRITADTDEAARVAAGTRTSLPGLPNVVLRQDGFALPATALKSFAFRAPGTDAAFGIRDVIADETTSASIFLTGDVEKPTGANILLANGVSGYFQLGIVDCTAACELTGGIVLDRAGPFGTIESIVIDAIVVPSAEAPDED